MQSPSSLAISFFLALILFAASSSKTLNLLSSTFPRWHGFISEWWGSGFFISKCVQWSSSPPSRDDHRSEAFSFTSLITTIYYRLPETVDRRRSQHPPAACTVDTEVWSLSVQLGRYRCTGARTEPVYCHFKTVVSLQFTHTRTHARFEVARTQLLQQFTHTPSPLYRAVMPTAGMMTYRSKRRTFLEAKIILHEWEQILQKKEDFNSIAF